MPQVQSAVLDLDGTAMDYVRFGQGERPLVILPGLSLRGIRECGHAMAHMYRPLARAYAVYILDCKRRLPEPCTLEALAADAARAMDTLGLGQADVLGISMGGMIAQYLALARPELVRRLVLAVTLSRPNGTLRAAARRWVELAEENDYEALVRDVMARTYSAAFLERFGRILPQLSMRSRPADLGRFRTLAQVCLGCDTYGRLERIRCPVFVVGGGEDRVVTGGASAELAERLGCEAYMYEGLGHSVCEEASKDFCARVLAFLRQ